jgi:hypothetical protein
MAYLPASYVTGMSTTFSDGMMDFYTGLQRFADVGFQFYTHGWTAAGDAMYGAVEYMQYAWAHLYQAANNNYRYWEQLAMNWIKNNLNSGGAAALTMGDLLTAMLTAKYDELQAFIGIEDAFRSAIWDQPFNSQYYAALANGFRP